MMTSEAYQMAFAFNDAGDVEKTRKISPVAVSHPAADAKSCATAVMSASGALNLQIGGPAVFPHLPDEILESMKNGDLDRQEDGPRSGGAAFMCIARAVALSMFEDSI